MDLILCHQTADFDSLGSAVGLSLLRPGSRIVLTGGAHPTVGDFLALHRDELALIESRSVQPETIGGLIIVDNSWRDRLGKAARWLDIENLKSIEIYDHHGDRGDINATRTRIEAVGAATTLVVEELQQAGIEPCPIAATVMALGIHVDTGSLTFKASTGRDARALAWLMEKGADQKTIGQYCEPRFSETLQEILAFCLESMESQTVYGFKVSSVLLETEEFVSGLSGVAGKLLDITESDALLFAHTYPKNPENLPAKLTVIGRARIEGVNLKEIFAPHGGGGHPQAASVNFRSVQPKTVLNDLLGALIAMIPPPPTARELMSSPVRTIRPDTTIEQAQRILFRYGHSGLSVVDENDRLVGVISRRDLDLALHHGFSHAPVKGYMARNLKTINPLTSLPEIEELMVTYDIGRLPVLDGDRLIGIVTRTDVLRQVHRDHRVVKNPEAPLVSCLLPSLRSRLQPAFRDFLEAAARVAGERGWHLYLVGGAVRDILLAEDTENLTLQDIDLVVDGIEGSIDTGAGVELALALQSLYPPAKLSVHGEFQTAILTWEDHPRFGSLWVDIATARTEFYPYPAANPEVEASSIRQDLYRRDFTVNALAARLTGREPGELLDFFGGLEDLKLHRIRVLHPNSFIEDPTRIYRAVRFATRLGFEIEPLTEDYIRYAIDSGVYDRTRLNHYRPPALTTRLKAELQSILEADYWYGALLKLNELRALECLHGDLHLDRTLNWRVRYLGRWLKFLTIEPPIVPWLARLEILLASLEVSEREKVASALQLPKDSVDRLDNLEADEIEVNSLTRSELSPGATVKFLRKYKPATLILIAARGARELRFLIWHYLTHLSKIRSPLDGNDLKSLGYKPGPLYAEILDTLLFAALDGKIRTREEAIEFTRREFPS